VWVAKRVGDEKPARFLSEPTPTRKLIITRLIFYVASFFTVWFTENFHPPFSVPKKPAPKQKK
jgi:hypothetical protein